MGLQDQARREFLKLAGAGVAGSVAGSMVTGPLAGAASPQASPAQADSTSPAHGQFDVRAFGAKGDGTTVDSPGINRAIEAAASAGGGTVHFPAGNYLCYSIHLRSNVSLVLEQGAVVIAADPLPPGQPGGYDEPEPAQPWEAYQDYGHNHWHNSLIWGEGLHDVSIYGPGRIWGRGLSRNNGPEARDPAQRRTQGVANKSISLKNCHNVLLKDLQILHGGWFGVLATGVDNLIIDGLTIDTNRDGIDIDCCRNVRVSNCSINSPWDDAIVPKSSYALGYARATENLTITDCYVTGTWQEGTMLDATWKKIDPATKIPQTGRIKLGTESNGGFKNVTIANCVFEGCQGLAIESEDGAVVEDITVTNITMRDIVSAPIFMRLGSRLRGPADATRTGSMRRVILSNFVCSNAAPHLGSIISGVPSFPIEDLKLHDIYIQHRGGAPKEQATLTPPELEKKYPDPDMFGPMPSQGFFLRHVRNLEMSNIEIAAMAEDPRAAFVLQDVTGADFFNVKTPQNAPVFDLRDAREIAAFRVRGVKDGPVTH